MTLSEKVEQAKKIVTDCLAGVERPVIACSFGKDSMVMLDLLRRMGKQLPILYWKREHHFPAKNAFANRMIAEWELETYDYPPLFTQVVKKDDKIEVVNNFQVGRAKWISVPSGIIAPKDGEKFLCALNDMYGKPTGSFNFPWDCVLIGHKSSDIDPLQGAIPLLVDVTDTEPKVMFPLRHFTDADVWEYTKEFAVPQDMNRYKENGEDVAFNNDYYPACTACMNPEGPETVWCPKLNQPVENVSQSLNWVAAKSLRHSYWGN